MKNFTMAVAQNEKDVAKLARDFGFHFNAAEVALAECMCDDKIVVFSDTQEDEPGHFVNVVMMEDDGSFAQYVSKDGHMDFAGAVAQVASVAASIKLSALLNHLRAMEQIV